MKETIGILTSGGDCPGLNAVIRAVVKAGQYSGFRTIGFKGGFEGLLSPCEPVDFDYNRMDGMLVRGGTILGAANTGAFAAKTGFGEIRQVDPVLLADAADNYKKLGLRALIVVGGDGSLTIAQQLALHGVHFVGVPKTIDNDLNLVDRTFGFETAVYKAAEIITSAHIEARGAANGLSIVKLMGRDSGFIAAYATLANTVVNICLVPEVKFRLEGQDGLLEALRRRFERGKTHAVLVVAEGAGQDLFEGLPVLKDASGNVLKHDIGDHLVEKIRHHFDTLGMDLSLRYFDPSYSIRSVPARGTDAIFCYQLAENAVHAAMAGRTDVVVGSTAGVFTHVPIVYATSERKKLDVDGPLWHAVLSSTRQLDYFKPDRR